MKGSMVKGVHLVHERSDMLGNLLGRCSSARKYFRIIGRLFNWEDRYKNSAE